MSGAGEGRKGRRGVFPHLSLCSPNLQLPSLFVLFQAPDLLQEASPLLPQPHDLLVGFSIVLCSPPWEPTTFRGGLRLPLSVPARH